jgi:hypothetical protein
MTRGIRHIWARADQHVVVHRRRGRKGDSDDTWLLWLLIGVILLWVWLG